MNALSVRETSHLAEQLDSSASIDKIEEDKLPKITSSHDSASKPCVFPDLLSRLERLARCAHGRDSVPFREAFCGRHEAKSLGDQGGRQAALISMILNFSLSPRGVVTSTVSPFL
jgi:hypothetical protein